MTSPKKRFEAMLELTLERLADQIPHPFDVEVGELITEKLGDGLRLGIPLDSRLRRWLKELRSTELDQVLDRAVRGLGECPLPTRRDDDVTLELAVGTRDRAESTSVAVHRSCVAKGTSPIDALSSWVTFLDELQHVDDALGTCANRAEIEEALGERCALLRESDWTSRFAMGTVAAEADSAAFELEGLELPLDASPPDSVVAEWVELGQHSKWVEGFARQREEFAETLGAVIDTFREMGEPIGLVARRWEARRQGSVDVVAVPLAMSLAAATEDEVPPNRIPLGTLAPLSCEALLVERRESLELLIHADPEPIAFVEFGAGRADAASATGAWGVSIDRTHEPILLRVVTTDGREFSATIRPMAPTQS